MAPNGDIWGDGRSEGQKKIPIAWLKQVGKGRLLIRLTISMEPRYIEVPVLVWNITN